MSNRSARHLTPKYKKVCPYCGKEFLAKMQTTEVCYSNYCQNRKKTEYKKRRRERQQREQATS